MLLKNIKYYFFFAFMVAQLTAIGQTDSLSSGLIFEDEKYETIQRTDPNDGAKADLPSWVNLSMYCPTVRNQGKISSCVGWSTGYGAMTIQRAILSDCKDKKKINQNAHSALFLFNQIKKGDCIRGSKISDALDFLTENGNCLAGHFDFDINDCSIMPNEKVKKIAKRFVIEDYLTLFGIKDDPRKKVFQVKKTLAQKRPVIIGMSVKRNFYELKDATFWHPNIGNTAPAGGHAMVVVGYDDRKEAFRIFNSWGKEWGDEGFIWVKYKDFGKYCKYGYVLYLVKKPMLEEKQVKLAANLLAGTGGPRRTMTRNRPSQKRPSGTKPRPRTRPNAGSNPPNRQDTGGKIDTRKAQGNIDRQTATRSQRPASQKLRKTRPNRPRPSGENRRPTEKPQSADSPEIAASDTPAKQSEKTETSVDVDSNEEPTENSEQDTAEDESENGESELTEEAESDLEISEEESQETPDDEQVETSDNSDENEEEMTEEEQQAELDDIFEVRPLWEFSGDFVFREFTGFNAQSSQPEFAEAAVKLENDTYTTTREVWEIGQRFQLLASTKSDEQYLYIFSIDGKKNLHFHWPRQEGLNEKFSGENRTALLMNNGSDVAIPGTNKVLKLANVGTDRLVVLFSKKKIRGLKQLAEIAVKKEGDFMTSFRHTLGSYAVPRSDIRYFKDRIGFEATTRGEGYIVPLVFEVTAQ